VKSLLQIFSQIAFHKMIVLLNRYQMTLRLCSKCLGKELPSSSMLHVITKIVQSTKRPWYDFNAAVLHGTCTLQFSPQSCVSTGDKGKFLILCIPLFTLFLLSKIVCSLKRNFDWMHMQGKADLKLLTHYSLNCTLLGQITNNH